MNNIKIEIGQRYTNCTVIGFIDVEEVSKNKVYFRKKALCKCDCSIKFTALNHRLINGSTTSCVACKKKKNGSAKIIDITGQKFGKLRVLKYLNSNLSGKAKWLCKCDCGNEVSIAGTSLRKKKGGTKSCGCLSTELRRKKRIKLEGKVLGNLNIDTYLGNSLYNCICLCGKKIIKKQQSLIEKTTKLNCGSDICNANTKFIGPVLSYKRALKLGLKFYSDGKSCSKGHVSKKYVSQQGCYICHQQNSLIFAESNPKKIKGYYQKYRSNIENKVKRNKGLKERYKNQPIYKYVNLLRSRIGKVLRNLKIDKNEHFNRNKLLSENILYIMNKQNLTIKNLINDEYELDHIKPLSDFMWSQSITANRLIDKEANSVTNLQFLTKEEHRSKTNFENNQFEWSAHKSGYKDFTLQLYNSIKNKKKIPDYFVGYESEIEFELKICLENKE